MSSGPIPPSLSQFQHYFEADRISWDEVKPGLDVVVEAYDMATERDGTFGLRVVATEETKNGLTTAWLELNDNQYNFVRGTDRKGLTLPRGTLMQGGISCEHFPETSAYMAYLGGIAVNRDFSFDDVQTPDGDITDTILVPQVRALYSFLPSDEFVEPDSFRLYKEAIARHRTKELSGYDQQVTELDGQIAQALAEYYPNEAEREQVHGLINTFHPEGRYKLAVLLEYSREDGVQEKYLDVLRKAVDKEFVYAPPVVARGLDVLPASQRGWAMMIQELGLRNPRPNQ